MTPAMHNSAGEDGEDDDRGPAGQPPDRDKAADRVVERSFKRRLAKQLSSELGPTLTFFVAFMATDIYWASAIYAAAASLAFVVSWTRHQRLPVLPLVSAVLVVVFAGLTLVLDDATFIKIKPTVTNGFFALVVGVGWLVGFRLIDRILRPRFTLDEAGLRKATIRVFVYLAALAVANEIAWRSLGTEAWVVFKVFGIVVFNLAFAATQLPMVKRHLVILDERKDA
jgi:intracellular septation protein